MDLFSHPKSPYRPGARLLIPSVDDPQPTCSRSERVTNAMKLDSVQSLTFEPESEQPALAGISQRIWYGGPENRLAYYVATKFLEPGAGSAVPMPNTLVLYGPHASGKSALLRWLYEGLRRRLPAQDVQFPSLSELTRRSPRGMPGMHAVPPILSLGGFLLLDDLHKLADRPAIQRALIARMDTPTPFFQLIVTCLDAPWSTRLQPRLVSRLAAGLTVRMSPPGVEARRAFLNDFQTQHGVTFSQEAARWLTHGYCGSFAEMAQLVRVSDQRHTSPGPISLPHVTRCAGNEGSLQRQSPKQILASVCREFGVSQRDLLGHSRRRTIVTARAVAIHALRQLTDWSLEAIGAFVGKRDHSTVLNALRRVNSLVDQDPVLRSRVENVVQELVAELPGKQPRSMALRRTSVQDKPVEIVTDPVTNRHDLRRP